MAQQNNDTAMCQKKQIVGGQYSTQLDGVAMKIRLLLLYISGNRKPTYVGFLRYLRV